MRRFVTAALCVLAVTLTCSIVKANVIDLTCTSGTCINSGTATGAIGGPFIANWMDQNSTGTGVIAPFLRIQGNGGNEMGYNTDITPMPWDTKPGLWTHPLLLSDVPVVTINGTAYREFLLDINEPKSDSQNDPSAFLLSLNQVQIFQTSGDRNDGTINAGFPTTQDAVVSFPGISPVFQMNDATILPTGDSILLDFSRNPGSGWGDMFLYVKDSDFNPAYSNLIMFAQFGDPTGLWASTDGFEEWAVRTPSTTVPDGGLTLMLLGGALVGLETLRRRFRV